MKNLILTLTLVCMGIATQAHNINPMDCGANGRIKVKGTQFDYKGFKLDSVFLYITVNNQSNGTIKWTGTIFVQSGGVFTMDTMPYFNAGQKVFIREYERNNINQNFGTSVKWSGSAIVSANCAVMPITLTSWAASVDKNDNTLVHLAWSVDMESNVSYYRIDGSTDNGVTWDTAITTLKSLGDTNLKRDYKLDYRNPLIDVIIKTAGFGALGMILVIAIFAGSIRNRAIAGTLACLLLVTTFACKKSLDKPAQTTKYNAVRLSNVDIDGSVKTFETRFLKD